MFVLRSYTTANIVSILLLWIVLLKGAGHQLRAQQDPAFQSFFSGLYFWKTRSVCYFRGRARSFNPSSLDCTSESPPGWDPGRKGAKFQSFFSGLYFWKIFRYLRMNSNPPVSILLLWIVLLKVLYITIIYYILVSFNPSSLDCTSESYDNDQRRPIATAFQSFFSGLYFWKAYARQYWVGVILVSILLLWIVLLKEEAIRQRGKSFNVSILLLWIVLLKARPDRMAQVTDECFNPSSLDCTSERDFHGGNRCWIVQFQSFFSGLYFWKFKIRSTDKVVGSFQSFFSGLYFWKRCWPAWSWNMEEVSILLLWIVLLKVSLFWQSWINCSCFNPSSLDCTSERGVNGRSHRDRGFVSILLLWIVLLKGRRCLRSRHVNP